MRCAGGDCSKLAKINPVKVKINPVKVKKDADKEEKAGRLDKAIALHQQLLKLNSRDWNTINKVGDLYARMGKNREASVQYAKVAEFYADDGFLLKAIAIWKKINRLDASALEPYLKLADLYAKQGLMMEAKSQYQIVVDEYIKRGKARDAGDVLQKMADIDPGDLKIRSRLADLYMRAGQKGKAIEEHIAIAEQLNLKGHLPEALQVLQKGLKIDGQDSRLMLELARLHLVQNDYSEAVQYLEQVSEGKPDDTEVLAQLGDAYLGSGRVADAERVFQRLVDLEPGNENHRTQMGRLHIAKNDLDRALDEFGPVIDSMLERQDGMSANFLLQEVLEKDAQHVKTLVRLVAVNRALGNEDQVASTYQELTEAYIKKADWAQAASVLEILIGMDPDNRQHSSKLEFVKQKLGGDEPVAVPEPEPSLAIEVDEGLPALDDLGEVEELGDLGVEPEPALAVEPASEQPTMPPQAGSIQLSDPPSEEDKEFIEEHLAEGRVFRKYGLIDKALDQFDAVIARFPDHIETRLELKEVFEEKGEPQKAARQCIAVAEIHRLLGDEDAANEILDQARELAPELVPEAAGAVELEAGRNPTPGWISTWSWRPRPRCRSSRKRLLRLPRPYPRWSRGSSMRSTPSFRSASSTTPRTSCGKRRPSSPTILRSPRRWRSSVSTSSRSCRHRPQSRQAQSCPPTIRWVASRARASRRLRRLPSRTRVASAMACSTSLVSSTTSSAPSPPRKRRPRKTGSRAKSRRRGSPKCSRSSARE